jgi:ATP-dependent Clp protease ATP-binding subunit ClpA
VLDRLAKEKSAILFIDEIHTLVGAGAASGGAMDGGNLLKPALASGALRCIGSTTFSDVKQSFDRDRALARRFQKIDIVEPTESETVEILKGLRSHYESHHGVTFSDEALESAVALSAKYLKDLHLPDKAIDVIDEAGAAQKLLPADQRPAVIGPEQIERVVAKMARVPVQAVSHDDTRALATLDVSLREVIFGQDAAIAEVASAIKMARSGLRAPEKTIGSFLFAGPTGVGKTELARQLARIMGVEFIRYDMSEYMEKHAVSRPHRRAARIRRLRGGRAPHRCDPAVSACVLLLDEIEKGAPGHVRHPAPGDGPRDADRFARPQGGLPPRGAHHDDQRRGPRRVRPPAGLPGDRAGRFHARGARTDLHAGVPEPAGRRGHLRALGTTEVERVVDKQIEELRGLVAAKNIRIELDPEARSWLAKHGFDRAFGARPMARLVDRVIKKPLSERLLFGSLAAGDAVRIAVKDDAIVLVEGAEA